MVSVLGAEPKGPQIEATLCYFFMDVTPMVSALVLALGPWPKLPE